MNHKQFDWSITNKELIILVPNYNRKNLLIPTLKRFRTTVPDNKWMWLIVNDGPHEPMEDLEKEFNLRYFTFERNPANERNGCMIRNKIIKNCQSKWLCTKDPEIIIDGDIVNKIINLSGDVVFRPHKMVELQPWDTQKIIDDPFLDLNKLDILRQWEASDKRNQAFHAGCCIQTQRLKNMRGYNELYKDFYGFEDWEMLERLKKSSIPIIIDKDIETFHINHFICRNFHKSIVSNEKFYKQGLQNLKIIANEGKEWGNGI